MYLNVYKIKLSFIILIFFVHLVQGQISVCSWNLKDFGGSKSISEIDFIANTIKDFDVIAIQEVVAKDPAGVQAVAILAATLNRNGAKWDYAVSDPTTGSSYKSERYAYIWKTNKLTKIGDAWLEKKYNLLIDREAYFVTFKNNGKQFTLVNFHAITKSKQPETEIKYFKYLPLEYPKNELIFCGDFNCPQSHSVFNPLKSMGFVPLLNNQKTTLKEICINNDCLESEFDNVFYNPNHIKLLKFGVLKFYKSFDSISQALSISDHIPIYFEFSLN